MQTAAEALERGAGDDEVLRSRLVSGLVGHTRRLNRLSEDLLQLARLEGGRLRLEMEVCSLATVARRTVDEFAGEAHRRGLNLGLETDGELRCVGDEVRLQHAQDVAVEAGKGHGGTGRVLVCDSYNGALKWLDPATRRVESWVRGLHEPAGVTIGQGAVQGTVYVADTNAHRVVAVDVGTGAVEEVWIAPPASSPASGRWYIS